MLGHQWPLNLNGDCLPTGIFFFKGMSNIHNQGMAKARQFGHIVVALEEELLDDHIHCHIRGTDEPEQGEVRMAGDDADADGEHHADEWPKEG